MKQGIKNSIYVFVLMMCIALPMMSAQKVYATTDDEMPISQVLLPDEVKEERIILDKPVVKCSNTTATKVFLQWSKVKGVKRYYVYRATVKDGVFKLVGKTTKTTYTDKTARPSKIYYYKIYAVGRNRQDKVVYSPFSKVIKATTLQKVKKTAYVGDSVMSGLTMCGLVKSKGEKVICKVGVNPYNFYNGAIMDELLDYGPDRMYIMLGMNCLVGKPSSSHMNWIIKYYKSIIKECLEYYPNMQIVVLPVSPTRPSATVKNCYINKFNKLAKKMADQCKVYYYDYTESFRDVDGAMKKEYNGGDGIHWNVSTYKLFKKKLDNYSLKID